VTSVFGGTLIPGCWRTLSDKEVGTMEHHSSRMICNDPFQWCLNQIEEVFVETMKNMEVG